MIEIWKDVVGYEGIYKVSNTGKIKSLNYNKTGKEKILATTINKHGYEDVTLYNKKLKKTIPYRVHRLVAIAFIENDDPINKTQVNHKDECKTNNNVNNLEWCTPKYNMDYGTRKERAMKSNEKSGYEKMQKTRKEKGIGRHKVICVTNGKIFDSVREAADYYNINESNITKCCKGKRPSCGKENGKKLEWKYLDNTEVND